MENIKIRTLILLPVTTIRYDLPEQADVSIIIYNLMGNVIWSMSRHSETPGYKSVQWDGRNASGQPVSTGMYFYAIHAGKYSAIRKMVLLK